MRLADGSTYGIVACDRESSHVVERLSSLMKLSEPAEPLHRVMVTVDERGDATDHEAVYTTAATPGPGGGVDIHCDLPPFDTRELSNLRMLQVAQAIAMHVERNGGLFIHGGLAECEGAGVVLAGPSQAGKSTASRHLLPPWRSLSDDLTLVVRTPDGHYRAHPWPTWSAQLTGEDCGPWDVQHSVPLRTICFLAQADDYSLERVKPARAACLLNECAEQAWWGVSPSSTCCTDRHARLNRLDNICRLSRTVPSLVLRLTHGSRAWQDDERILAGDTSGVEAPYPTMSVEPV